MVDEYEKIADLFGYSNYNYDMDEKEYALSILMLLESFYRKYSSKTLTYYLNHFEEDCDKLEQKLLQKNNQCFEKYVKNKEKEYLLEHNIPVSKHNKVPLKTDLKTTLNIITDTIKTAIDYLKKDARIKMNVWKDKSDTTPFDCNQKMKDSIKKIKKGVSYATGMASQKTRRSVQSFVYSKEARFKWVCYGSNPCDWCISQSKKPSKPLKEWEFDHPHGNCGLEPDNAQTSKAFNELLGID